MVGGDGVEPPESSDSRFTVCPAAIYGISTHLLNINFYMAELARLELAHRLRGGHLSRVVRYHYSIAPLAVRVGFEPTRRMLTDTTDFKSAPL